MKKELLSPGEYAIEIILRMYAKVHESEEVEESDLLQECRKFGETVDWDVKKL